jgi:hypothetical protein
MRCSVDADLPNSVLGILRAIAAAADRIPASGEADTAGRDQLDLGVVEILAAEPFAEQDAAEKLVRDALRD